MSAVLATFVAASGLTIIVILGHFIVGAMAKAMGWFATILLLLLFFAVAASVIIGLIMSAK